MTGENPHNFSVFELSSFDQHEYLSNLNDSQSMGGKTLGNLLSQQGKWVVVHNLAYTCPPDGVNEHLRLAHRPGKSHKTRFGHVRNIRSFRTVSCGKN
jgi:hypothetical protein